MTTATITTKCPDWCESIGKMGDGEDGHDGPHWPSLPIDGGFNSLEVSTGVWTNGRLYIHASAGNGVELTAEDALKAGRYLIEAAEWLLAHRVA